jgi:NADH:ubiquinone oxidoreductase subunit D
MRTEEMRQSCRIILQCLQEINLLFIANKTLIYNLPVYNTKYFNVSKKELKSSMEATIHHFKYFGEGFTINDAILYRSVEAPKGEFGIFLVTNDTNKPYRCKIKAPGFLHLHGIDFLSHGHLLADVVTIIGTLDVVFGEIDR